MKKLAILITVGILYLTGCTKEYGKTDIEKFVRQETSLRKYEVSDEVTEIQDEEGYTDYRWTVTVPGSDFKFYVLDDYGWGLESTYNHLSTDYDDAALNYIKEDMPELQYFTIETAKDEYGMYRGELIGSFTDRADLRACYDELQTIKKACSDLGFKDLSVFYYIQYMSPLRNQLPDYEQQYGDIGGMTDKEQSYEDFFNQYVRVVLDYRYDVLNTFTDKEIREALKNCDVKVGLYFGEQTDRKEFEEDKVRYYDDIIGHDQFNITFGSLYEILKREGFNPVGNPWHYTFTGNQNDVYEISYDFADYQQGKHTGYYYLKNGEQVPTAYYSYNYFSVFEIEEMTGLKLVARPFEQLE